MNRRDLTSMAERDPHALAREALALSENATPGPWRDGGEDRFADDEEVMRIIETAPKESELPQLVAMVPTGKLVFGSSPQQCVANVAFIVRARELLPALARAVLDTERADEPDSRTPLDVDTLAREARELYEMHGQHPLYPDVLAKETDRICRALARVVLATPAPAPSEEEIAAAWREYDEAVEQARYTNRYVTPATKDAAKQAIARVDRLRGLLRALLRTPAPAPSVEEIAAAWDATRTDDRPEWEDWTLDTAWEELNPEERERITAFVHALLSGTGSTEETPNG